MNIAAFATEPHLLFLDTETTGLREPEIIELGIVDTFDDQEYQLRFNPKTPIEPEAQRVHGLSHADLSAYSTFRDTCEHVYRLLAGRLIVTWGDFDLRAMCHTAFIHNVSNPAYASTWIDAMQLFMEHHGLDHRIKLASAASMVGVTPGPAHTALGDARTVRDILEKLG